MITVAIAFLVGLQGTTPVQPATTSASEILSRMFAHYAEAQSLVGTIKMTQSANGASIHTETNIQFDRPSLIYLHQMRDGSQAHEWYLTSDGKTFSFDPPDNRNPIYGRKRPVEYVGQHNTNLTLPDFLSAASHSLGDLNPMIKVAIGSKPWLQNLTSQWASIVYRGRVTVNGQMVQAISGQYREHTGLPVSGDFEAYVADNGDFVRYVLKQRLMFPQVSKEAIDVSTTWDADLKLGAKTDRSLYKVVH